MSDITKKILSIEPEINTADNGILRKINSPIEAVSDAKPTPKSKPAASGTHASDIPSLRKDLSKPEDFPKFISRESQAESLGKPETLPKPDSLGEPETLPKPSSASKLAAASAGFNTEYTDEPPKTAWITRAGIALTLLWIGFSIAVYFALFGTQDMTPMALSAFIMAIIFPAILITILWTTWRRLSLLAHETGRVAHAAQVLTRADESALINTRKLALGIQSELTMVDEHLGKMLERFSGLKNDLNTHTHDINTVGLALSERSEDVGRSLTLQRQALESITNTFDTRMSTLSDTIEAQNQKLADVTQQASDNIGNAKTGLTELAETISQSGETAGLAVGQETERLQSTHDNLTSLHDKLTLLVTKLASEQEAIKAGLLAQSETLQAIANKAKDSSQTLKTSLSEGQEVIKSIDGFNQDADENILARFKTMEKLISDTQIRADEFTHATSTRVHDSLAQTRKDLSKLETEMQVLRNSLSNAREEYIQLKRTPSSAPEPAGIGRLGLKPTQNDFPPVEPPRHVEPKRKKPFQSTPNLFSDKQAQAQVQAQAQAQKIATDSDFDTPINLGADMEIENPDDALTGFNPDILRPAMPEKRSKKKGFGQTKTLKGKNAWRWRDMLGGLEQPDDLKPDDLKPDALEAPARASDAVKANLIEPLELDIPLSDLSIPEMLPSKTEDILKRLARAQLAPSAIVTEGTVMEAAKARMKKGPAAMISTVEKRLDAPISHLREHLLRDSDFENAAKDFTVQYGQVIAKASPHDESLRSALGNTEGRAYLLCVAAINKLR